MKFFFLLTFAAAIPAIISGGIAERARFYPQLIATAVLVALVAVWLPTTAAWLAGFLAGLTAENRARAKASRPMPAWRHPYVGYLAGAAIAFVLSFAVAGVGGALLLVGFAFYAQVQLFLSDYVQHYGLRRKLDAQGRGEPIGPQHSWNAPHWYSNAMMLNSPRHSDHHMHPLRSFPSLELVREDMPMLPYPLPVMGYIALVPRVWHRVMDRRVAKWMPD